MLTLFQVASSDSYSAYWMAALVLATDILLLALIVILAEQVSSFIARERRQFSLQKIFLLTAAICIYLGFARLACWQLLSSESGISKIEWRAVLILVLLSVIVSFPVALVLGEGFVWFLVDYQKRRRDRR